MRVAIIIERLDPARGGRERSTAELAAGLAACGCDVSIVCQSGALPEPAGAGGPRIVALGPCGRGRVGRLRGFLVAVREHLSRERYDISHAMLPTPGASVYQLRGGTLPGLREAHLRRLHGVERLLRQWTWPLNRSRAALAGLEAQVVADERTWCLPVSGMVAEELKRYYGRSANVRVVFNGVDVPPADEVPRLQWRARVRKEWGVAEGDVVLLCPAMNYQLKGVREAIVALGRLRRRQPATAVKLVMLGRQTPEGLQRVAAAEAVGASVLFQPVTAEIWSAYAAADAMVLLTWYDPCSRVVLEATAAGVPCLTTRFNGAAEALDGAGLVVPTPADLPAVVAAYEQLADPAARAALAEGCRRVAPRLTMRRHVDELVRVYQEIRA